MTSSALDMSLDEIIKKDNKSKPRRRTGGGRGRRRGGGGGRRGRGSYGGRRVQRRNGGGRFSPYQHVSGGNITDIATGPAESRALKVGGNSEAKKVAGAIAHCVRIGGAPPALMCTGPRAINQAVKAIAIARKFLSEEENDDGEITDLIGQPRFEGQTAKCVIRLRRSRPINMDMEVSELTALPNSDPYKVAGAIAGKIRDGERVGITAIGANSVFHALESIAVSQTYLKDDRIDIKFAPSFTKKEVSGKGEMNAIHFSTLSRRLD